MLPLELILPEAVIWDRVWSLPLAEINPDATMFPLALTFPWTMDPELLISPEAVILVVDNEPPAKLKVAAVIVPLELISPEAVISPLKVWESEAASPNILDPYVCTIEEVTIDDVILVTFKLVAEISPVTIIDPVNWWTPILLFLNTITGDAPTSLPATLKIKSDATPSLSAAVTFDLIVACSPPILGLKSPEDPDSAIHLIAPIVSPTWGGVIKPNDSAFSSNFACSFSGKALKAFCACVSLPANSVPVSVPYIAAVIVTPLE